MGYVSFSSEYPQRVGSFILIPGRRRQSLKVQGVRSPCRFRNVYIEFIPLDLTWPSSLFSSVELIHNLECFEETRMLTWNLTSPFALLVGPNATSLFILQLLWPFPVY